MALLAAMSYELSRDTFRTSQALHELQATEAELRESEQRLSLAVHAADFAIWTRELTRNEICASDKWRELFGFTPSERLGLDRILSGGTLAICTTPSMRSLNLAGPRSAPLITEECDRHHFAISGIAES
jgi:PAS domain-containing protein